MSVLRNPSIPSPISLTHLSFHSMSGLGIVLEEAESPRPAQLSPQMTPVSHCEEDSSSHHLAEPLLPPLPKGEPFLRSILTSFASLHEAEGSSNNNSSYNSNSATNNISHEKDGGGHSRSGLDELTAFLGHLGFPLYASYELDSPLLNIDAMPLAFPEPQLLLPLNNSSNNTNINSNTSSNGTAALPLTNSLPLRRLKLIKKGIRKLSLLKMASSSAFSSTNNTPTSEVVPLLSTRPSVSPIQPQSSNELSLLLALSLLKSSTFSQAAAAQPAAHSHTLSLGLNLALVLGRRRTLLNPMLALAASTPPIPSPVIMLLENLTLLKKNLNDTEQCFFETLQMLSNTSEVNLTHLGARDDSHREKIDSIDKLATSDELIEYLLFLHEHKKSIEDAYDVTKDRLSHSGWCSTSDLENLALQRDCSLSQIDTKLLKIEERLNSRFNLLMLNNANVSVAKHQPQKGPSKEATMSPSLKVLESRCLSFAMET